MAQKPSRGRFTTNAFLTLPGPGKTIKVYSPKHRVFSQGDSADSVYICRKEKSSYRSYPLKGKRP